MRKIINILLLVLMSINILAAEASTETKPEIKKEITGKNKSKTTEGRTIIKENEKDPSLKKIDLNEDKKVEDAKIEYKPQEKNDALLADVSEAKTRPNYVMWGIGILGVLLAGLVLTSK